MAKHETLAAVDLGSNSFHMIIARMVKGQMRTLDRLREMVQLAAGLSGRNHLTLPAQRRALACLERFGQRLRALPPGSVRAVGTNTLRLARNSQQFLKAAQRALGHPIEIIAGREEARLIYLGVAHKQANDNQRRLVIDIGGGSTEFIIGRNFEAQLMESVGVGCVSSSLNYFPGGKLTRVNFERAEIAARQELQPIAAQYRAQGWDVCLGSSGTVKMVQDVVNAQRWRGDITLAHLRKIRKRLIAAGTTSRLKLEGLRSERAGVFPGGVAILLAAFESLGIKRMRFSEGALREGLLHRRSQPAQDELRHLRGRAGLRIAETQAAVFQIRIECDLRDHAAWRPLHSANDTSDIGVEVLQLGRCHFQK